MADPVSSAVAAIVNAGQYIAGAFAAVGAGSATAAQTATVLAVQASASLAINAVLTPQVDAAGSPTEWRADPDAALFFLMGRKAVGGQVVHVDEWGSDNRYKTYVTVYSAAAPINDFGTCTADGETVTFSGDYGRQASGTWADIFWGEYSLGAQPANALQSPSDKSDPTIGGTMPAWGSSYKLSGKACAMHTMAMDKERQRWANGEPKILQTGEGLLVWDPRADSTWPGGSGACRLSNPATWVYSQNPYLHALKWALGLYENGVLVGGIGADVGGIDVAAFIEGANVADANDWIVSAWPSTKDDKHQVLLALLQAGGGRYARKAGKISCIVRTPRTSVATLTGADTAGPFEIEVGADRLTRLNTIIPRCVMETHGWEMVAQPPVSVSAYVTADGGVRERGVDYPYVAIQPSAGNTAQPAQLAAYDIVDSRETIRGTVPLKAYMAQIEPGDVFTIDEPGFLLDGVECLCVRRQFDPAADTVTITFVSETDGKHDYALGLDPTPPDPPGLTAPDIYSIDPPGVSVFTASAATGAQPAIAVTADVDNPTARAFRVEYRPALDPSDGEAWDDDDSGWVVVGTYPIDTASVTITGLEPSTDYQVAVSYVSQFGVIGDRRILDTVTTGEMVATRAIGSLTQDDIDAALAFLASGNEALAGGLGILEQVGALNHYRDPLFVTGPGEHTSTTAPIATVDGDPRALEVAAAVETDDTLDIVLKPLWPIRPGARAQVAAEVTTTGPLGDAALSVRFFDIDLAEIEGGPVEIATAATGNRAAGFVESEDIPAGAYWAQVEISATATGDDDATLAVHEIFAASAAPNQSAVEAFRDPQDEGVAKRVGQAILDQAHAYMLDGLVYETAVSRAAVLFLQEVTANSARYQASASYQTANGEFLSLVELFAANGTSRIMLMSALLAFVNDVEGDPVVAMEIRNGIVHFLTEARLSDDAAFTHYTGTDPEVLRICIGKHPTTGDVGIFLYDETGAALLEFNTTDDVARLYPSMASEGFAGVDVIGSATDHDLTTDSSPRQPEDFIDLEVETDEFDVVPGAKLSIVGLYRVAGELNTAGWFRFEDRVSIVEEIDSVWTVTETFDWNDRFVGFRTNTGAPVGLNASDIVPPEDKNILEFHTFSGGATVRPCKVRLEVRAKAFGNGECVNDSPDNTKLQNSLKISKAYINAKIPRPGVFTVGS